MIVVGEDIYGGSIVVGQRCKREDGVIGVFELQDFQLRFVYTEVQENGATSSLINDGYKYEII